MKVLAVIDQPDVVTKILGHLGMPTVPEGIAPARLIVITHNKKTMEVADQLYGITMEEAGISKTVNVRIQ